MLKTIFKEEVPFTTKVAMILLALTPVLIEGGKTILNSCSWWVGEPEIPNGYKK